MSEQDYQRGLRGGDFNNFHEPGAWEDWEAGHDACLEAIRAREREQEAREAEDARAEKSTWASMSTDEFRAYCKRKDAEEAEETRREQSRRRTSAAMGDSRRRSDRNSDIILLFVPALFNLIPACIVGAIIGAIFRTSILFFLTVAIWEGLCFSTFWRAFKENEEKRRLERDRDYWGL